MRAASRRGVSRGATIDSNTQIRSRKPYSAPPADKLTTYLNTDRDSFTSYVLLSNPVTVARHTLGGRNRSAFSLLTGNLTI